jgi:hypothetical protein
VSFAVITLYVASSVCCCCMFRYDSFRKLLDKLSYVDAQVLRLKKFVKECRNFMLKHSLRYQLLGFLVNSVLNEP